MRRCYRSISGNKMSCFLTASDAKNPDDDFVMHGKSVAYWERNEFLNNSRLTGTTSRLTQHSLYNPDNYRERTKERKHAKTLSDLASNLEVLGDQVDRTLNRSVREEEIRREVRQRMLIQEENKKKYEDSAFTRPSKNETLKADPSEDELLGLYEKYMVETNEIDELSGKPKSPRNAQWYVNPTHLDTTGEAPTQQSIGKTYRYGEKAKDEYADRDQNALNYFPVTLGSSYELCAHGFPASEPLKSTAPPSMRHGRSKSATGRLTRTSQSFRVPDRSFKEKQHLDKMYLLTSEAPTIGASTVSFSTPHQLILGKLRLERLRLEEAKLLELKRMEELERIRGPKPKWYEFKGPEFHYEAHKNTQMIRSVSTYQDMLDYREDLLRSSYNNLKKYNQALVLA